MNRTCKLTISPDSGKLYLMKKLDMLLVYDGNAEDYPFLAHVPGSFADGDTLVRMITAKDAHIPAVAASDVVVFLSTAVNADTDGNFSELFRAFSGVNLAPRSCGFCVASEAKSVFAKKAHESRLEAFAKHIDLTAGQSELTSWLQEIINFHRTKIDARI